MKRLAIFFLVLGSALVALYFSQRSAKNAPVSANALLNMAADAQRDFGRLPMHFTRLSDAEEPRPPLALTPCTLCESGAVLGSMLIDICRIDSTYFPTPP